MRCERDRRLWTDGTVIRAEVDTAWCSYSSRGTDTQGGDMPYEQEHDHRREARREKHIYPHLPQIFQRQTHTYKRILYNSMIQFAWSSSIPSLRLPLLEVNTHYIWRVRDAPWALACASWALSDGDLGASYSNPREFQNHSRNCWRIVRHVNDQKWEWKNVTYLVKRLSLIFPIRKEKAVDEDNCFRC